MRAHGIVHGRSCYLERLKRWGPVAHARAGPGQASPHGTPVRNDRGCLPSGRLARGPDRAAAALQHSTHAQHDDVVPAARPAPAGAGMTLPDSYRAKVEGASPKVVSARSRCRPRRRGVAARDYKWPGRGQAGPGRAGQIGAALPITPSHGMWTCKRSRRRAVPSRRMGRMALPAATGLVAWCESLTPSPHTSSPKKQPPRRSPFAALRGTK